MVYNTSERTVMVMTLGEIVRTYRTTNHLTLQQFADRALLSKG